MEQHKFAAQWLGERHTSAREINVPTYLQDRSPEHYLERLQSSRDAILFHGYNNVHATYDFCLFEVIVSQFDVLEACWDEVE